MGATRELWIEIKSNIVENVPIRKVQDFRFLRQALSKQCPFTFIPPLNITDKDLGKVDEEVTKSKLI